MTKASDAFIESTRECADAMAGFKTPSEISRSWDRASTARRSEWR